MSRQKLGQHFLANPAILARIAAACCEPGQPLVVEIGPGHGALTAHLLERARRVVAIELDSTLAAGLRRRYASERRLEVVEGDALEIDFTQWGPAVLAGNLPYYAATPILERAVSAGPGIERVTARPGSRAYGYFTVRLAMDARAELLFDVKPGAFRPPPKVDSSLVRLVAHPRAAELGIEDPEAFRRFLSACFRQKRKNLRNNLTSLDLAQKMDRLPEAGARAEQLSLDQFAELYRKLYDIAGG